MTVHAVVPCDQVTDCSPTSWELMFSICNPNLSLGGICQDAVNNLTQVSLDSINGLLGVYSTDAQSVTTIPSTYPAVSSGVGAGSWSNLSNALHDDGSQAVYTYPAAAAVSANPSSKPGPASDYILLTDFGFSIPLDSTIVAIVSAWKATSVPLSDPSIFSLPNAAVWNTVTTVNGSYYYYADPSSYRVIDKFGIAQAVAVSSPPWPADYITTPITPHFPNVRGTTWQQGVITPPEANGIIAYASGNRSWIGASDISSDPARSSVMLSIANYAYAYPDTIYDVNQGLGYIPGCQNGGPLPVGPVEKSFCQTPTKQTWTPDEVNDPSFGVGISLTNEGTPISAIGTTDLGIYVNCAGVAVYYTPGQGGNPFANCNGVEFR